MPAERERGELPRSLGQDYFFSLALLQQAFPQQAVLLQQATVSA
jgi:hypothetical protein